MVLENFVSEALIRCGILHGKGKRGKGKARRRVQRKRGKRGIG
jgi:hypothetical protein